MPCRIDVRCRTDDEWKGYDERCSLKKEQILRGCFKGPSLAIVRKVTCVPSTMTEYVGRTRRRDCVAVAATPPALPSPPIENKSSSSCYPRCLQATCRTNMQLTRKQAWLYSRAVAIHLPQEENDYTTCTALVKHHETCRYHYTTLGGDIQDYACT